MVCGFLRWVLETPILVCADPPPPGHSAWVGNSLDPLLGPPLIGKLKPAWDPVTPGMQKKVWNTSSWSASRKY